MTTDHGQTPNRVTLPDRPDVPRRRRQRRAVSHLRQHAGRRHDARPRAPRRSRSQRARQARGRGGFGGGRGGRGAGAWEHNLGGCESGFTLPDLTDTNIVWASCYGNEVTRYDAKTKLARSVSPVAAHARFRAQPGEVSLPLDRRRSPSIRSITTPSTTAAR